MSSLAAATVAVACTSDDGDGDRRGGSPSTAAPRRVTAATPAAAELPDSVFALGVASGDPTADAVIIWTRLASDALAADGGAPAGDVELAYDVATDAEFADLVASGVVTATASRAHSVHVDVTNLRPATTYHYRFRAGDQTSATGTTSTAPAPDADVETMRFVFASCQDYQWGHYAAWAAAAAEPDLDLVVFLGDYIYETNFGDQSPTKSGERVWANAAAYTLDDYRQRYAQVRSDPSMQAAHAVAPWIVTFDDHEVSNNYAGDVTPPDPAAPDGRARRLAAYQAWYEHMPVRITPEPDDFDDLDVHRSVTFGSLASLFAIETRQHADPPPCRPEPDGSAAAITYLDEGPGCAERDDPARTNLGREQERWLHDGLAASRSSWNVIANPTMLAGLNVGSADEPAYTLDMWDGYPAVRKRLLDHIVDAEVSNPVVVTGDWHASFVLDVKADPQGPTVMPEFLATSISTVNFAQDYRAENPHVRYFEVGYGYGLVTINADELRCDFKYVGDQWDPESPIAKVHSWRVVAGSPEAEPV